MEKLKEKLKYGKRGITLIALVITIVILLILAGVTINLLLSDTGLLSKAQQAKNTWENEEQSDINAIGELTNELDEMLNGTGSGGVNPEEIADITTLTEIQTENTKGKDIYGNVIMVPKGFKVVTEEATTVPEGIVIEDGTGTETTTGNQFVWIPVGTVYKDSTGTNTSTIQLGRYIFDSDTENDVPDGTQTAVQLAYTEENPTNYVIESEEQAHNKHVIIEGVTGSKYIELSISRTGETSGDTDGENATAKNLGGFVQSVRKNGGYYIARYEASYGGGYNSEGSTDLEKYANAKPLSKISTANSITNMTYDDENPGHLWNIITQINASKVCKNMYLNDNNVGVESDLINSYAWDTAIVFIQEMGNTNYANSSSVTTENSNLMNTGKTNDIVCNIYDMAGNLAEYTTEKCNRVDEERITYYCTARGGIYSAGSDRYVAFRISSKGVRGINVGFRPILYITNPN